MPSIEELRAEVRRLLEAANNVSDHAVKRVLSSRALELSQRAEALADGMGDPKILRANIDGYRTMLASGKLNDAQHRIVTEMLADAEALANPKQAP